jgi:hypothetical protein
LPEEIMAMDADGIRLLEILKRGHPEKEVSEDE